MNQEQDPIKPSPTHQWRDDHPQTRCIKCGAYKHLSSGFFECPQATPAEPEQWAIVELLGHVKLAGKLTEVEKFGSKMGRLDIPQGDGFITRYFGGGSVYSITPVTEAVARHVNKSTAPAPVSPWDFPKQLTAGAKMVDSPVVERYDQDFDDDEPYDGDDEV